MLVFLCQITITFIYPAYIYGFVPVAPSAQQFYIVLLPILKILLKNWISRFIGQLEDAKPEVVIFNIELFNALYVACCMQQSASIIMTLVILFIDAVQALLSLRDVMLIHDDVVAFMALIPAGHPLYGHLFAHVALHIFDKDSRVSTHPTLRVVYSNSGNAVMSFATRKATKPFIQNLAQVFPASTRLPPRTEKAGPQLETSHEGEFESKER